MAVDSYCGAVFKITPAGTETVVHGFAGGPGDGWRPDGPLVQGRDGALYGVTFTGGPDDVGTVYRVGLDGSYAVIHAFSASAGDAKNPTGNLIQARDGYLYGTARGGQRCSQISDDCGTIFRIAPNGDFAIVHAFTPTDGDGWLPIGLVEGPDGNFYGTTEAGGNVKCSPFFPVVGCGTVFRMTPAGAVTILHAFGPAGTDGVLPIGPPTLGLDGAFYGTTRFGGGIGGCPSESTGCGTVYRITADGTEKVLYAFSPPRFDGVTSYSDGYDPTAYLTLGRDGNFYGMTESGGNIQTTHTGTIFRLTPAGVKTTLYMFGEYRVDPASPNGGLVQGADGAFYGVTNDSGKLGMIGNQGGAGTVFRLVPQ